MIDEAEIPYISEDTDLGSKMRAALIDSNIDDDVMTDDELVRGAQSMLEDELAQAVK